MKHLAELMAHSFHFLVVSLLFPPPFPPVTPFSCVSPLVTPFLQHVDYQTLISRCGIIAAKKYDFFCSADTLMFICPPILVYKVVSFFIL